MESIISINELRYFEYELIAKCQNEQSLGEVELIVGTVALYYKYKLSLIHLGLDKSQEIMVRKSNSEC